MSRSELTKLLASALGQEKSDEVVATAARSLGFGGHLYTAGEVRAIFRCLATVDGLIGVVARFAVSRGDVDDVIGKAVRSGERESKKVETPQPSQPRLGVTELVPLLAPALGIEKARDALVTAAARLGVDPKSMSRDEAALVFDSLSKTEGIVGVVARFAKARFILESSS